MWPRTILWSLLLLGCSWVNSPAAHELGHTHRVSPAQSTEQVAAYLTEYRHTGDDGWLIGAETFLWSDAAMMRSDLALLRVWHAQAQHKFPVALEQLNPLLAGGSRQTGLWLLKANLLRVQGLYEQAKSACRVVLPRQILNGQLCLAQASVAAGETVAASLPAQLAQLVEHAQRDAVEPAIQGWRDDVIAQLYAAAGQNDEALSWAHRAYATEPLVQRQAALADLLLKSGEPSTVLELISEQAEAPALVVLRLLALQDLGQIDQNSTDVQRLDTAFSKQRASGDLLHAREMAIFYLRVLPQPELARELALTNWRYQREAEDRTLLTQTKVRKQVDG